MGAGDSYTKVEVEAEVERLVAAKVENDELLLILGEVDGALFASPVDKRKRGRRFLRNVIERIQNRICSNDFVRANSENESTQRKALAVAATIDFLGAKGAATASVLIIQIGLDRVCSGHWEQRVG